MTDLAWLVPVLSGAVISLIAYLAKKVHDCDSKIESLKAQVIAERAAELRAMDRIERKLDEL